MNRFKKLSLTLVVCFAFSIALISQLSTQAAVPPAPDAKGGESLFKGACKQCHTVTDEPLVGPGLKGVFTKRKLENGKAANEANIRAVIKKGGGGMPSYDKKFTDAQMDDLIAYLKTL